MASSTASCGGCPGSPAPLSLEQQRRPRRGRRPQRDRAAGADAAARRVRWWRGSGRSRERSARARHAIVDLDSFLAYLRSPRPRAGKRRDSVDIFRLVWVCVWTRRTPFFVEGRRAVKAFFLSLHGFSFISSSNSAVIFCQLRWIKDGPAELGSGHNNVME
jgi:hypothetical protein